MTPRLVIFRFRRRPAISTMIGSVIVLSLLLTELGTMVFVSQQYDQYQQTVNKMAQNSNRQLSEYLVVNSPGMTIPTVSAIPGWGSGCGSTYACYNATISNLGTVGVQITRIYINSTGPAGSGCSPPNPQPCILNPQSTSSMYAFNQANEFINAGELNHVLYFALPFAVSLPNPTPTFPENTILLVTSRGNVFPFQWPFKVQAFGQSQSAFSSGIMKIAYQGTFDSSKEPGLGGTLGNGYCHKETALPYPAGVGYAEKLTVNYPGVTGGVLWFVNPWVTATSSSSNDVMASANAGNTHLYIYLIVINTGNTAYSPTNGTIDLTWSGSNHIDGYLIGVYYNYQFYSNPPSISPGMGYYAIFKINIFTIGTWPTASIMFFGAASVTNAPTGKAEDQSFYSGTILLSGLWIQFEATSGSCT